MRVALGLLMLAAAAAAYEGKYAGDERLARLLKELPARRKAAEQRLTELLGLKMPNVEIVLEDAGNDTSGAWAEARGDVLVLKTEYLVLGAHDLDKTLVHELFHCLHRKRLGDDRYFGTPIWAREGAALYVAGEGRERARVLAAHVGRDPLVDDPVARLVDGLESRHTFLDYYEDVAAFESAEERHGRKKTLALVRALLQTERPHLAVRETLGEGFATFSKMTSAYARRVLKPLVSEGRREFLGGRDADGVYAAATALRRARDLQRAGKETDALRVLRERFLKPHRAATTTLAEAIRLEVELLKATGSDEYELFAARATLDLIPFK